MNNPEIFDINDPNLQDDDYIFGTEKFTQENLSESLQETAKKSRGFALFGVFLSLLSGILGIAFSLWIYGLYGRAKELNPWLGWVTLGLSVLAIVILLLLTFKELYGFLQLRSVKKIRQKSADALANNRRDTALSALHQISHLYNHNPNLHQAQKQLMAEANQQLDAHAILTLTEEYLLTPLDKEAKKIIQQSGQQVAVSTALSRIMILDVVIVFYSCWRMIRRLAELYGLRPSNLSLWRLLGQIFTHLIISGGMAAGEDVLGSIFGQGMAAKLSTRLGEGVVNGLLTCRVGLVALDHCRPMPYLENEKPKLKDIAQTFLPKILK